MRVGITGSSGLIGSVTSKALISQGIDVLNVSFREVAKLDQAQTIDYIRGLNLGPIIHTAWPASSTHDYLQSQENFSCALATERLARAQLQLDGYLIAFGSVLDSGSDSHSAPYSRAKSMARELLNTSEFAQTVSWLRPYFVFSQGRWPNFLKTATPDCVTSLKDNSPREYIELSDIVTAVLTVLRYRLTGIVDIGSGFKRSPLQLLSALGLKGKLIDSQHLTLDIAISDASLLRSHGWTPSETEKLLGET